VSEKCCDLPWEPARKRLSGSISSRKDTPAHVCLRHSAGRAHTCPPGRTPGRCGGRCQGVLGRDGVRSLVRRGLKGVLLVTSDAHEGLKKALGQVLAGVSWQRCRVATPGHSKAGITTRIGPTVREAPAHAFSTRRGKKRTAKATGT
jgi:hypothetical protein